MSAITSKIEPKTYPLVEKIGRANGSASMALVALSLTPVERCLYAAMLAAVGLPAEQSPNSTETSSTIPTGDGREVFTVRRVKELAGINSVSSIRRGLEGLVAKLSVERTARSNGTGNGGRDHGVTYRVFAPEEVIARHEERGMKTFAKAESSARHHSFERVMQRILENRNLSRRESQVALCCVEGLTNAEIGLRLLVSEQTVKFHLRNIFVKVGVKRRAELISRLLM